MNSQLLKTTEPNEVIVVGIKDETNFFIVLLADAENIASRIRSMEDDIAKLPQPKMTKNELALVFQGSMWHRVKIVKINPEKTTAEILYIDSGGTGVIRIDELKKLPHPIDTIEPLKSAQVRLSNGTIKGCCVENGAQLTLTVHRDNEGVQIVDIIEKDIICDNTEDDLSLKETLAKWKLDEALASELEDLSKRGLESFNQVRIQEIDSRNTFDQNSMTSVSKEIATPNSRKEMKVDNMDEMYAKVVNLRKKISVQQNILKSINKEKQINDVNFSNMLSFSVHSLGLSFKTIENQHMINMLIASKYAEKLVQSAIDFDSFKDLRTILHWKLNKENPIRINRGKFQELMDFLPFLNKCLNCTIENCINTAATVMLKFKTIYLFEIETNRQISLLLFNMVLKKHNFPIITFPMKLVERLEEVTYKAASCHDYKDYLLLVLQCCVESLESYSNEFSKEINQRNEKL